MPAWSSTWTGFFFAGFPSFPDQQLFHVHDVDKAAIEVVGMA